MPHAPQAIGIKPERHPVDETTASRCGVAGGERSDVEQSGDVAAALEAQAREHESAGRYAEAAATWEQAAQSPCARTRARALIAQARLLAGPLADPALARRLERRALVADPTAEATHACVAEAARADGDWLRLAQVARLRFETATTADTRSERALEAGRLHLDHFGAPTRARAWLEAGLDIDGDAAALHEAVAEIDRLRGDDDALLARLERVIELCGDATRPSILLDAASLHAERSHHDRALTHLERASRIAPNDALVLDALAEELVRAGRPGPLADVLERRAAVAEDAATRAGVLLELGELYEDQLFDLESALDAFDRAHTADPTALGALDGLVRLRAKVEPGTPAPPPEPAPEATRDPEAALAAVEREAETTTHPTRFAELALEIERLHAERGTGGQALPWIQRWVRLAPESPDALRALARLHDRSGHETELIATLEALDPMLMPRDRAENRRQLGSLYIARGMADDAARAFEGALEIEPHNLESLEGLVAMRREQGDLAALVTAQWRLAEQLEPPRRADCLAEVARLQEQSGDLAGAIATFEWMERDAGCDVRDARRLDALLERAGRYEDLEQRLRERFADLDPGNAERVAVQLRRAELLLYALDRADEAAAIYRELLSHAPESPEAAAGLERALRASIDAEGLEAFLADRAARATDSADRERTELERAVLLEEMLDRPDDARVLLRALVEAATVEELRSEASRRYEQLLERGGAWSALRAHIESRLASGDDEDVAALHEKLAHLCADRLSDPAGAVAHLEHVVEIDPTRADVWRRLGDAYERDGRAKDWMRAMRRELDAGCEPARALTLHARLAGLCVAAKDPDAASEHYERAFELDPGHAAASAFLIDRYRAQDRAEDVLHVLEARLATLGRPAADAADPASQRTALRMQIARVRENELDDLEGAISALEVALGEAGPGSGVATPLADCYQRAGYSLDLIELCRNAAAAATVPDERANWLVRLADAFLVSGKSRDAADAYRRALSQRPDDRGVQAALRELYREHSDAEPLARLLEAELTHLAGPAEVPVRLELMALLADALQRPGEALLHARRVLEISPFEPGALERAVSLSESLGQHETTLELLDARLARARTRGERCDMLARRAGLLAGPLSRPDDASAAYREALEADPLRRELRVDWIALLERSEQWQALLDCLDAASREVPEAERDACIDRAATIAWDRVGPEAALPWLTRLRALRPQDPSVQARIAEVHRRANRSESLVRALEVQARLETDPARRRDIELERAARLEADIASPGRAVIALESARGLVPDDAVVLRALANLQGALGRHMERAISLESLIECVGVDPLPVRLELAALCSNELADPLRAARHWSAALQHIDAGATQRVEVLRSLAECHRASGDLEAWASVCEQELAALDASPVFEERRRELHRALANAFQTELSRPGVALAHLRALLDAPGDDFGNEERARLELTCLDLLRDIDDPVEHERRLADYLHRHDDESALWVELARLREERLHATADAQAAYRTALDIAPDLREALHGLRRTSERLGRHEDVAYALEQELQHPDCSDPAERAGLLRRLADVCWHRLQSTTRASRYYAAALEALPGDFASLRALERLLEAMEDWRGALDLYESEVEMLGDGDAMRRRDVWLRVAALASDRTDEIDRARYAYDQAAALGALDTADCLRLAELHERAGDLEAFAQTFGAWCEASDANADADDHMRLATCLESLERISEALDSIDRAGEIAPERGGIWAAAARLREATGDLAGSADALCREAEQLDSTEAAARLLRAARLVEPEDPRAALDHLRVAAGRAPASAAVHAALTCLAGQLDLAEEACEAAARALDLDTDGRLTASEIAIVATTGGDAATVLERLDEAAGLYRRALEADPEHLHAAGAYGETLARLGDHAGARPVLAARLRHADPYPERAHHAATLGRCLERADLPDEALARYEEALVEAPCLEAALEGCVRLREQLGHVEEGVAALERWARAARDPADRAARLHRAARWERSAGGRDASAEAHLRQSLAADPDQLAVWTDWLDLLLSAGRLDEVIEAADRAAAHALHDADLAQIALLQARAFEQRGERREAAETFGLAADADPRLGDAVLAQARLLRGFGEWRAAADALTGFAESHDDASDDPTALAEVYEQLGRLQAGPLEALETAVGTYRQAVLLAPERVGARAALAELLSHRPADADEALFHHRIVLAANPADAGSLRVALRIARQRGNAQSIADGLRLLQALGAAAPHEIEECQEGPLAYGRRDARLDDGMSERLRQLVSNCAGEIAQALQDSGASPPESGGDAGLRFRSAARAAEGRLTAPPLAALPTSEVAEVIELLAALALTPDEVRGDGRLVNALSDSLRRRHRKRLRRVLADVTLDDIAAVDFERWRQEVRALAAWVAIRETDVDLRTALVALLRDEHEGLDDPLRDDADITALVAACGIARSCLQHVVLDWLDRLA
jgi:tetratricopeptide (TPR) repeat protein